MGLGIVRIAFRRLLTTIVDAHIFSRRYHENIDIILECHDGNRSATVQDKRYSPILDSIRDDLEAEGYSCMTLLKPSSTIARKAYGSPSSAFSLTDEIIWQTLNIVDRLFHKKKQYSLKYAQYVYKRLLESCKPILVMGIQPSKELVVVCNYVDIPIIDILHGYGIVPSHLVYGLDAMDNAADNELCSDYVALDEISKSQIEKSLQFATKQARVWSFQSPVLDATRPFHHGKTNREELDKYEKICLISLQWGINRFERKHPHEDGELHPKIHGLIENARTENILFIIKPHPLINRRTGILQRLVSRYSSYDNVVVDSDSTLYQLLSLADINLTIFSTVVREAAFLGVPSMIFSTDEEMFSGENYMFEPEIEAGIAQRVGYEPIDSIVNKLFTMKRILQLPNSYKA